MPTTHADAVVLATPVHHANLLFDAVGRETLTKVHGVDAALLDAMKEDKAQGYLYDRRITATVFLSLSSKQKLRLNALFAGGSRREFSVEA